MSKTSDICLTPADLTLLEAMLRTGGDPDDEKRRAIREKLASARIVFLSDLPADRVTTGARVRFQVNQMKPEERILTGDTCAYPTGSALDAATPRGIALLGHKEGDRISVPGTAGPETLTILRVLYSPGTEPSGRAAAGTSSSQRPVGAPFRDDDPVPPAA